MRDIQEKDGVIAIYGAREHNLKNIDLTIPRNSLTVITGLSGSGKSSLAFDTIYAEGQRRYMETLLSYARQFVGKMERPDVDKITGLSPVIALDQKTTSKNPRGYHHGDLRLFAFALCSGGRGVFLCDRRPDGEIHRRENH